MEIIEQVHEGMHVVDSRGEKVGTVRHVRMGDPDAASTAGNATPSSPMTDLLSNVVGSSPDVSPEQADRLTRMGFVQVNRSILHSDAFVASDQLARVDNDVVHLSIAVE